MSERGTEKSNAAGRDPCEVRCFCGALVARLVEGGVELRCRRCKRAQVVALERTDGALTRK